MGGLKKQKMGDGLEIGETNRKMGFTLTSHAPFSL